MKTKNKELYVSMPDMDLLQGDKPGQTLVNFYEALIPSDIERPVDVNISKIKVHEDTAKYLYEKCEENIDDENKLAVSMLFMNQSPFDDNSVPKRKVLLEEGAFTTSVKEKKEVS